jgi:hypothetical protein
MRSLPLTATASSICGIPELSENRRLSGGKAHVARKYELAVGGTYATFDLRDGDQTAYAQVAKQEGDRGFSGPRCLRPVFLDPGHVDMGNEIVGVSALENEHLESLVDFGPLNKGTRSRTNSGPSRFMGSAAMSANRTAPSLCTVSVVKTSRAILSDDLVVLIGKLSLVQSWLSSSGGYSCRAVLSNVTGNVLCDALAGGLTP